MEPGGSTPNIPYRSVKPRQGALAMTRIVTGLFDKRREVDLVVEHLVQEFDIPREQVQVCPASAPLGQKWVVEERRISGSS
jgi:hypothetical protein